MLELNAIQDLAISWGVLLIPMVTGLVLVCKSFMTKEAYKKRANAVSLCVGIVCSVFVLGFTRESVIVGVVIGLSASGLWSTVSNHKKKKVPTTEKEDV